MSTTSSNSSRKNSGSNHAPSGIKTIREGARAPQTPRKPKPPKR